MHVSQLPVGGGGATPAGAACPKRQMRTCPCPTLLAAVLTLAATAGPAQGASRVIVHGAGFGHGVGMSQYGAYGFATHGKDHAFILGHYYLGTQLGRLGGPSEVRVLLRSAARISFTDVTAVAGARRLDPSRTYAATPAVGATVVLRSASGRNLGTYEAPLRIVGSKAGLLLRGRAANAVTNGRYRGDLELRPGALGMSAINVVSLEDYVRGVVAGEVPGSWPAEALRAQAVAARTYAIATRKDGAGFDQFADTRSQMYVGISGEQPSTNAAVAGTSGEVVSHDGTPIVTYYFSTSGGRTENVENSFLGAQPEPWLQSVDDPYDGAAPRHRWTVRMTLAQADARLGGLVKGQLRRIRVLQRGRSPRVVRAQVVGTRGRTAVTGPQLRSRLGLYDTWARFEVITTHAVRGDRRPPRKKHAPPRGPGTGGAVPRAAVAASVAAPGGAVGAAVAVRGARAVPSAATAITSVAERAVAGAIAGRVAPAIAGRRLTVERRAGRAWVVALVSRTRAAGRYRASVRLPGLYRVRYRGEAGPAVRVG
jgi:stage II sporulation protein D